MIENEEITRLVELIQLCGQHMVAEDLIIQELNPGINNHIQGPLPRNRMAVYLFFHFDQALKVGKVNIGSNARYQYHHYSPNSNGSVLARNLLKSQTFIDLIGEEDIGFWMKNNLARINILIPSHYGRKILHFIEAYFILKFNPLFENGT